MHEQNIKIMICPDCNWFGEVETEPHLYTSEFLIDPFLWALNKIHYLKGIKCEECKTSTLIAVDSPEGRRKLKHFPIWKQNILSDYLPETQNEDQNIF
jgi:hypothetical protein